MNVRKLANYEKTFIMWKQELFKILKAAVYLLHIIKQTMRIIGKIIIVKLLPHLLILLILKEKKYFFSGRIQSGQFVRVHVPLWDVGKSQYHA